MAKYVQKPLVIEAEPYHKGLEDKWSLLIIGNYGEYEKIFQTEEECLEYIEKNMAEKEFTYDSQFIYEDPLPLLESKTGFVYIKKTDYIITNEDGSKRRCKKETFEENYELE